MDYSSTLSKGWNITWRHKWMWLLALIPALTALLNFGVNYIQQDILLPSGAVTSPDVAMSWLGGMLLLNCLLLIASLLIAVIGLATRGGLIAAAAGIERGESYTFGRAFGAGWRKLLPLLGMSIVLMGGFLLFSFAVALVSAVVFFVGVLYGGTGYASSMWDRIGPIGILGFCCLMIVFIIAALVINLVYPFALRGIVLRNLGAIASIRHGWQVMRENLGEIILLALPFFVLYVLLVGLYAVFMLGSSFAEVMAGDLTAMTGVYGWEFFILFIIWSLISAVLAAWQSATFTLAYGEWTGKGPLFAEDELGAVKTDVLTPKSWTQKASP